MKIILDAMGGDNAPLAPVMGAVDAAKDFGAQVTLVGRSAEIMAVLKENGMDTLPAGIAIEEASDVVDMHDDPASVCRYPLHPWFVQFLRSLPPVCFESFDLRKQFVSLPPLWLCIVPVFPPGAV